MDIPALLADADCLECVIEELAQSDSVGVRLADVLARAGARLGSDHATVLGLVSEHWDLRLTTAIANCMRDSGRCQAPANGS